MLLQPKTAPNPSARRILLLVFLWDLALLSLAAVLAFSDRMQALPAPLKGMLRLQGAGGLIGWSILVSLFGVGAAALMLGAKTRRPGWWLCGLLFVLLSMGDLTQLKGRLGALWDLLAPSSEPWALCSLCVLGLFAFLGLRRLPGDTADRPGLRRAVHLAAGCWGLAGLLHTLDARLFASARSPMGFSLVSLARYASLALQLVAPLLILYALVSLIEYFERQARIEERAALRIRPPHVDQRRAA